MRPAVPLFAILLFAAGAPQRPAEPFVPVGVWYGGERTDWRRDLPAIRSLGFNTVWTTAEWAAAEPVRGTYGLEPLTHLLTVATEAKLAVIVQLLTGPAPAWLVGRYPDAAPIDDEGARRPGYCLDHPGVRADAAAFIRAVSARAAAYGSFYAIDVWREPRIVGGVATTRPDEFCYCPHTRRRFREWLKAKYVTLAALNGVWGRRFRSWDAPEPPRRGSSPSGADAIDWATFAIAKLREDLKMKADASAPRGARPVTSHSPAPAVMLGGRSGPGHPDDWWMATAVDHYGTSAHPRASGEPPWPAWMLPFALDGIRSAGRERGWWLSELQADGHVAGGDGTPATTADLRVWSWTALARGARAIAYRARAGSDDGVFTPDGTPAEWVRTAGRFADLVTSNAALFAPLRPRASRVAIVYDPVSLAADGRAGSSAARESMLRFYQAMFARNIQADFIHPDEIATGLASNYLAIFLGHAPMLPRTVLEALKLYVRNGGALLGDTREITPPGAGPEVRIDGGAGLVEARFLESADALLLVAINHADVPREVTMTFTPDVPEAIWQNMETGAAVNFVGRRQGPTYTRAFAPRDVVVLMIRKRWR